MTQTQLLQNDLSNAIADGELLARTQIANALTYLVQGQRFDLCEIRAVLEEVISNLDLTTTVDEYTIRRSGIRLVN